MKNCLAGLIQLILNNYKPKSSLFQQRMQLPRWIVNPTVLMCGSLEPDNWPVVNLNITVARNKK